MNNLSLLLYLADISHSLRGLLTLVAVLSLFACIIAAVLAYLSDCEDDNISGRYFLKKFLWIPILCSLLVVFLPSKNTMYAIAASEIGEQVLKSSTMSKAQKAVDAWLDEQVSPKEDTQQ